MRALKTFALAGGLIIGAASLASAADLPPPPPAYPPAPLRGTVDAGIYLRGDVGVGLMGDVRGSISPLPATVATITYDDGSFGHVGFAGVGLGYQFNSWFRFDVTGELRTSARLKFRDSYTTSVPPPDSGVNSYTGSLSTALFLANAYIDLGNWHGLTPFLGAGVGFARHRVHGVDDSGVAVTGGVPSVTYGFFSDASRTNFAWALMAGLAYDVTPNVKLELGYRYLNMGKANSGPLAFCSGGCPVPTPSVRIRQIESHDIRLGFRWLLSGPDYAPPPMAVMRKG
jgi:opacity protein-like surface antigen